MIIKKAFLAALVGVSLCLANISGVVTDTGSTAISGAVVQLENGGQTATTGADGRFTLVTTATLPVNGKLLPKGLSARISGNILNLTVAEQSAVEVATFDLGGTALSTVRKTLDAGIHTIALPQRSAGVYLYKVKSDNRVFVLKGNSVGGGSSGRAVFSQGPASNGFAKLAKSKMAFNDAVLATKAGYLNYLVEVTNSDTSGIVIKMISQDAGTVTDIDDNVYHAIRIGNQVWTVENLRVTKYNDGTAIPEITDSASWYNICFNNLTAPAYCYYNSTTNSDSITMYGALYNWYVVSPANPNKLAPTGWHVPTNAEWDTLQNYLIAKGYNWDGTTTGNKIAKSLAAKSDWIIFSTTGTIGCDLTKNNSSGFSALPGGLRSIDGSFYGQSDYGSWWSTTENHASYAGGRDLYCVDNDFTRSSYNESDGLSVRLVRD